MLFPLTWTSDGWPIVSDGQPQMQGALPFARETAEEGHYVEEDEEAMDCSPLYWYGVRGPAPEGTEFQPKSRRLVLSGILSAAGKQVKSTYKKSALTQMCEGGFFVIC